MTGGEKIKTPNNLNNLNTHLEKDKSEEQNGAERSRTEQCAGNPLEEKRDQPIRANGRLGEISENRVRID